MTENNKLPWEGLTVPLAGYNWLLTNLSEKHRFWWGKNHLGCPVLLFELNGNHAELFRRKQPKVKGLQIDIVAVNDLAKQGVIITLTSPSDSDIFYRLCLSIIRAADVTTAEEQAVLSVLHHLDRWRDFLALARKRVLTEEQIRGLFAELIVIHLLLEDYGLPPEEAVAAWKGPLGKPQDFAFADGFLEVKATGGRQGNSVRISSEHQLETDGNPLFLVAVELLTEDQSIAGASLHDLVRQLEQPFTADLSKLFCNRLVLAGYADIPEYDFPRLKADQIRIYSVTGAFPSIRASALSAGISTVRYELDLNSAADFLVPKITMWDRK